ncbi:MAG TPA: alpha/beta hydrolase [Phycisphaerales bacterium]|jgi:acetyl esterase/lipase|nr:alpha/beta hydrolase [Phycisphaerales bacterium]
MNSNVLRLTLSACALLVMTRPQANAQARAWPAQPSAHTAQPGDADDPPPARQRRNQRQRPALPAPDRPSLAYGADPMEVMDVWLANPAQGQAAPLLMFIHGGGFTKGSKEDLPPGLLRACQRLGITVASVDYRLAAYPTTPTAAKFPEQHMECARALQFLRHSAASLNIDPKRVMLSGSSAGGGIALWIAFHDDMADPSNKDPVLHESTRVSAALVMATQTTYDPRVIKEVVGGRAGEHTALAAMYGLTLDEMDTDKAHKLFEEASPVNLLTKDDPPVFATYGESPAPLKPDSPPGMGIHHPALGAFLKKKMDALGIECIVKVREVDGNSAAEEGAFLRKHLHIEGAAFPSRRPGAGR